MNKVERYGIFDIMGPIMHGPSSSHTGGATRLGLIAGQLQINPLRTIRLVFHGAIAAAYKGHKTDVGIIGGIMGIAIDDPLIKDSYQIAQSQGITIICEEKVSFREGAHPNTTIIETTDIYGNVSVLRGYTAGGGLCIVESVNRKEINYDGKDYCTILSFSGWKALETGRIQLEQYYKLEVNEKDTYIVIYSNEPLQESVLTAVNALEIVQLKPVMDMPDLELPFYHSAEELLENCERESKTIGEIVIDYEVRTTQKSRDLVIGQMLDVYEAMKKSVSSGREYAYSSLGGIFEKNAEKMTEFISNEQSVVSAEISKITRDALAVMEVNASMGKVATCPTAGSCGVLPAVMMNVIEKNKCSIDEIMTSMFAAAAIGMLFAQNATISGSIGGCQAEIGTASAMAAALVVQLHHGTAEQICAAAALAIGNLLGLVCDPVAGMVEIPCIQRNVNGALNAIACAEMALAGIDSVVTLDESISAMKEVGDLMHCGLKDTMKAGLSNCKTARQFEKKIYGKYLGD